MYYDPAIFPAVVFRDLLAMELLSLGLLLRLMIHLSRILDGQCHWKSLSAMVNSNEAQIQQYQWVMDILEIERLPPVSRYSLSM